MIIFVGYKKNEYNVTKIKEEPPDKKGLMKSLKKQAQGYLSQYKNENPEKYAAALQAIGGVLIADGLVGLENPFGSKKRSGIFGTLLAMGLSIVFMLVPVFLNRISGIDKLTEKTTATIQAVNRGADNSCSVTATYTVNGKSYTQNSSYSSSELCTLVQGSTAEIDYNPDNPGAWGYNTGTISFVINIFFFAGLAFLLSSLFTFTVRLLSIIFGWKLLREGRKLAASLPSGSADLSGLINDIKDSFKKVVFGKS